MTDCAEVMALICWRFPSARVEGVEIVGRHEVRTLSGARAICEKMVAEYGDGSHWVEPLNYTYDERRDTINDCESRDG